MDADHNMTKTTLTKRNIDDCRSAFIQFVMLDPLKGINKVGTINELCDLA